MEAQPRASLSAFHGNGHLGRGCQLRQRHSHQDDGPAQLQPAGDRLFPARLERLPLLCARGARVHRRRAPRHRAHARRRHHDDGACGEARHPTRTSRWRSLQSDRMAQSAGPNHLWPALRARVQSWCTAVTVCTQCYPHAGGTLFDALCSSLNSSSSWLLRTWVSDFFFLARPTAQRFSGCSQTCKVKPVYDAVFTTLPSAVHSVVQRRRVTLLLTRGNTISSKCKTQPTKYAHAGTSTTALSPGQWPARGRY
mmetsp:Transcript_16315/g.34600  ORF Transcript_16315/g.34600 Transcript_16315/m.34600 type:complete len:253 (+) Transcript_16315:1298-2056(+)